MGCCSLYSRICTPNRERSRLPRANYALRYIASNGVVVLRKNLGRDENIRPKYTSPLTSHQSMDAVCSPSHPLASWPAR